VVSVEDTVSACVFEWVKKMSSSCQDQSTEMDRGDVLIVALLRPALNPMGELPVPRAHHCSLMQD
jgi:hypothetical protein